ncbi:lysine exporter LysO family protein [Thorsellia kenyensis]|uniref:Lysine exporter LysO family protein n=1 Tax=Thorsellia kenyensis TaxID=1549888 RepID=A0ABV6CBJ0_9GAMM
MLINFTIILLPLLAGYSIALYNSSKAAFFLKSINVSLNYLVYVILFCMGLNLAFLDDLSNNLKTVLSSSAVFFILICSANTFSLIIFTVFIKKQQSKNKLNPQLFSTKKLPSSKGTPINWSMLKGAFELLICVAIGLIAGLLTHDTLFEPLMHYALDISQYALIFLIFLVGILLRQSQLTLKQIILNKKGLMLSFIILASSLLAGYFSGLLLGIELKISLALSSGFGWYSLSGILISEAYGPLYGSIAFFNDLAREILVILLIPMIGHSHKYISLGLSAATSMDFTLPILQKYSGIEIVPAAIVQGFILSLAGIVLMTLFS